MQGVPGSGTIGVHGGGHYTINGDPGGDLFTSPGDPAFYLHHGQIDRVWATWQNLDIANREKAIAGTGTFLDSPASANITLDTPIDVGYAGGGVVKMADLMSTTKGPFCYMYVQMFLAIEDGMGRGCNINGCEWIWMQEKVVANWVTI